MVQKLQLDKSASALAKIFGENCRQHRKAKNLSQAELSKMTGIAIPHLSNIENGRANPTLEIMEAISDALQTTLVSMLS